MYGGGVSLMQWLRAAGGALWLGMLAFGLSSTCRCFSKMACNSPRVVIPPRVYCVCVCCMGVQIYIHSVLLYRCAYMHGVHAHHIHVAVHTTTTPLPPHITHTGSPWPHIALLGILLLGMVRTPRGPPTLTSLLCLCLLLGASFVALLQFKGMRMVMRLDVQGKVGMALIHHGASVHGLGAGV